MIEVVKVKSESDWSPFNDTPQRVENSTGESEGILEFGHYGGNSHKGWSYDERDWEEVSTTFGRKGWVEILFSSLIGSTLPVIDTGFEFSDIINSFIVVFRTALNAFA